MKWEKSVFNFKLDDYLPGEYRGAAVPFAVPAGGSVYRIFYTARNNRNQSNIFYLDFDMEKQEITYLEKSPVLMPGEMGSFDDSGAMTSWIEKTENSYYLYYVGWNLGVTVPFRNSIGLAASRDGIHFEKMYKGPIMDRTMEEPQFCSSACVLKEEDGWKMWYLSCVRWALVGGKPKHWYHIKYASSGDGIHWNREGKVCIDFENDEEYAISRPSVVKWSGGYRMWYSYRGKSYRIGYAESEDGLNWIRKDKEAGIDVSEAGFDSEMICYPHVFAYAGKWYMLYNGNAFGMTGFGIATLEENGEKTE